MKQEGVLVLINSKLSRSLSGLLCCVLVAALILTGLPGMERPAHAEGSTVTTVASNWSRGSYPPYLI